VFEEFRILCTQYIDSQPIWQKLSYHVPIVFHELFYRHRQSSLLLYLKARVYLKTIFEDDNITKDLPELEKIVRSRISNIFNLRFREEDFISTLSDTVASYSALVKSTGFDQVYQNSSIWWANWNNNFIEPIRGTFWRTPSRKIAELEKYSLFHYEDAGPTSAAITPAKTSDIVPLLIVYAFINRHYILDLLPEVSVVRNLLKQGFDIYVTDWGYTFCL
jgi:polyhydroxyalkanoate synthase subunit PhaC